MAKAMKSSVRVIYRTVKLHIRALLKASQKKKDSKDEYSTEQFDDESEKPTNRYLSVIFYMVYYNNAKSLEELITSNPTQDINELNDDGISAIHFAAITNSIGCLKVLVKHGADIGLQDMRGQTPMHYAKLMENNEAIDMLAHIGASKCC